MKNELKPEQMENNFADIFERVDKIVDQPVKPSAIKEVWKQSTDGFTCKVTGRKLSKIQFKIYQDRSACGSMGFIIETK